MTKDLIETIKAATDTVTAGSFQDGVQACIGVIRGHAALADAARVRGVPADADCATCRHASLRESDEPCRSCIDDIRVYRNHSPLCEATPPAPAAADERVAELEQKLAHMESLCAAAYQLAGLVDAPEKWLDALSDAVNGTVGDTFKGGPLDLLPITFADLGEIAAAEQRGAERMRESLVANLGDLPLHAHKRAAVRQWLGAFAIPVTPAPEADTLINGLTENETNNSASVMGLIGMPITINEALPDGVMQIRDGDKVLATVVNAKDAPAAQAGGVPWRLWQCARDVGRDWLVMEGAEAEVRPRFEALHARDKDVWLIRPDGTKELPPSAQKAAQAGDAEPPHPLIVRALERRGFHVPATAEEAAASCANIVIEDGIVIDSLKGKTQPAPEQADDPSMPSHMGAWLTLNKPLHPNTLNLVVRFARALASKLSDEEKKYGYIDGWRDPNWMDECRARLMEHIAKGDPRDVAAYCAFLWHHDEPTSKQTEQAAYSHIKEPYTLIELREKIASNEYSAELLLQHAMLLLDKQQAAQGVVGALQQIAAYPATRGAELSASGMRQIARDALAAAQQAAKGGA